MSTFFEKLTGSGRQVAIAETVAHKSAVATRPPKIEEKRTEEKPMHIKVTETEPEPMANKEDREEEEGELTVDIYDTGDEIVIQSTVAGVKPEDLDISITHDTVSIRGKRKKEEEINEKNYYYHELFWGTFSRTVILPEEIDPDTAEASLKHGFLTMRLPKKKKGIVQKLKVKVA